MDKKEESCNCFYTVEPVRKRVGKEEFRQFVENYPRPLKTDVYAVFEPPLISYNDFNLANRWPYSIIAQTFAYGNNPDDYYYEPEEEREYYIVVNHEEMFASKTGNEVI